MFQRINQWLKTGDSSNCILIGRGLGSRRKGQIAIILMILIGIVLMLVAVAMNLGQISVSQVQTQITADSTAVFLASQVASYAEAEYRTVIYPSKKVLGGTGKTNRLTHYDPSTLWEKVLTIYLAIAIIVAGMIFPPLMPLSMGAAIALMSTGAAIHIHKTRIAPAYNSMWAAEYRHLPFADQFQRAATNLALQSAAADPVRVPDKKDHDMDGFFYGDGVENQYPAADRTTSRQAEVITRGPVGQIEENKINQMKNFGKKLAAFVFSANAACPDPGGSGPWPVRQEYFSNTDWPSYGLFDHDGLKGMIDRSDLDNIDILECAQDNRCNPNCLGSGSGGFLNSKLGDWSWDNAPCPGAASFDSEDCDDDHRWCKAADPFYENPDNDFNSLREIFGRDDENKFLRGVSDMGEQAQGTLNNWGEEFFSIQGATGVFKFFWQMYLVDNFDDCYWKKQGSDECFEGQALWQWETVGDIAPPDIDCSQTPLHEFCRVSLLLDALQSPLQPGDVAPSEDTCYDPLGGQDFLWKPGNNRYGCQTSGCKPHAPYHMWLGKDCYLEQSQYCLRNCETDPEASENQECQHYLCIPEEDDNGNPLPLPGPCNKFEWRDDALTHFIEGPYGLNSFIRTAYDMLRIDPEGLLRSIERWHSSFQRWEDALQDWVSLIQKILDRGEEAFKLYSTGDDNPNRFCMFDPDDTRPKVQQIMDCIENRQQTYEICLIDRTEGHCQIALDDFQRLLDGWEGQALELDDDGLVILGEDFKNSVYVYSQMFRHRKDFLEEYLEFRLRTTDLHTYKHMIENFNPFNSLQELYDYMQSGEWSAQDKVIYVWSEYPDGPQNDPLWRVVRVDTRLPTRCKEQCGRPAHRLQDGADGLLYSLNPQGQEPIMPYIERFEARNNVYFSLVDFTGRGYCNTRSAEITMQNKGRYGLGSWDVKLCRRRPCKEDPGCCAEKVFRSAKICFQGGLTAARIQRWDEPRPGSAFSWATGIEFWRQRFSGTGSQQINQDIETICHTQLNDGVGGAFLMTENDVIGQCWQHLNSLLAQGTERISCAEYYWRAAWDNKIWEDAQKDSMFGVRFAECTENLLGTFTND